MKCFIPSPRSLFVTSLSALAGLALTVGSGSAQVLVNETFESYADTAAMQVNWGATGLGTLSLTNGNPGQSAYHPGGTVNSWIGTAISVAPSATQNIVLTADIYDDGLSANERMTVGLRGGPFPLFEMGHYNSPAHYSVRINSVYGNENWVSLSPTPVEGWHRFEATFTANDLTITLDLDIDGTPEFSFTSTAPFAAADFTDLRFGGPSNASSAGGGVFFDNIKLELVAVPEPSVIALGGLGLLALVARRRR